jgi:hypothetical protein
MPIKSCTLPDGGSGYKWGDSGHCYSDRKDAERQAAAAHANGFTGDEPVSMLLGGAKVPNRAADRMAIDRATVRTRDIDGRMHVEITPISKANVCPYYGREIPFAENFGLDPDKTYMLLRDPVELAKAAPTSNNIQLLCIHTPVSPTDTKKEVVVGCLGETATFTPPYLTNSLSVWDADAITGIEDGSQRELSCSYRYVPDMTPGVYEGVHYDGRMTEIAFNHVALVPKGRAGPDVLVGDSQPVELQTMKRSQKVAVSAALSAYLRPALATDSVPQVRAITRGDYTVAQLVADAARVFPGKVDEAALTKLLNFARDEAEDLPEKPEGGANKPGGKADDEEEDDDMSAEDRRKARDAKRARDRKAHDGESEEEREDREKAQDAEWEEKDKARDAKRAADARRRGRDSETEEERKEREANDRKASDKAIARAVDAARTEFANDQAALRNAEKLVHPLVGELSGMKSAEEVFRFALDSDGVDTAGIHASALPALVAMQLKLRSANVGTPTTIAMDAASINTFDAMFPNRLKVGA